MTFNIHFKYLQLTELCLDYLHRLPAPKQKSSSVPLIDFIGSVSILSYSFLSPCASSNWSTSWGFSFGYSLRSNSSEPEKPRSRATEKSGWSYSVLLLVKISTFIKVSFHNYLVGPLTNKKVCKVLKKGLGLYR